MKAAEELLEAWRIETVLVPPGRDIVLEECGGLAMRLFDEWREIDLEV